MTNAPERTHGGKGREPVQWAEAGAPRPTARWKRLGTLVALTMLVGAPLDTTRTAMGADAIGCGSGPRTVGLTLAKTWKGRVGGLDALFQLPSPVESVKLRVEFFPFLNPPTNLGIGRCVEAEIGRRAIEAALIYNRGVDRLIRQDVLPLSWVMIGTTRLAELTWIPIGPQDLARLRDPALTTEAFQALYRELATLRERPRPFGMGPVPSPPSSP